jgi:hypothetical protein
MEDIKNMSYMELEDLSSLISAEMQSRYIEVMTANDDDLCNMNSSYMPTHLRS